MNNIKDIIIYVLVSCLILFLLREFYNWKNSNASNVQERSNSNDSDNSFKPLRDKYGNFTLGFGGKKRKKYYKNKGRNKK